MRVYKGAEMANGTVIKKCSCKHVFQDKKHGKGNRVHNQTIKGSRCTVCGSDKS